MPRDNTTAALSLPGLARGTAIFSPCGRYRYELHRAPWSSGPRLLGIFANPSYATAEVSDHTVTKFIGFAKRWGFGAISLGNLFAFVSTDPAGMYAAADPIGPENDRAIERMAISCDAVFVGWGDIGLYRDRDKEVVSVLKMIGRRPFCIGTTKAGSPLHPSRPGYDRERVPYGGRT